MFNNLRQKIFLCLLAAAITFSGAVYTTGHVLAQDQTNETNMHPLDDYIIRSSVAQIEDGYVRPTVENLSKLYWVIGKMDINNDEHIDNFMRINECTLYTRFYHNDFEWSQIRAATREHIQKHLAEFPSTFEITNAIQIGRYDKENQYFEVAEQSKVKALRRLDFLMNRPIDRKSCGNPGYIQGYPENLVIILNRPITVEKIYVKPELAELYIEEAKRQFETLPLKYQITAYERLAYLRLKVRVLQYKETIPSLNGEPRAVVFGRLEGYEIYADSDLMKPLFFKVYDDRSTRRRVIKRARKKIPDKPMGTGLTEDLLTDTPQQ